MPVPVNVIASNHGQPAAITETRNGRTATLKVEHVIDVWEIEDEWWRNTPIQRRYFRMMVDTGRVMTVFKDMDSQEWFRQEY